jgi:hypothetical protein
MREGDGRVGCFIAAVLSQLAVFDFFQTMGEENRRLWYNISQNRKNG